MNINKQFIKDLRERKSAYRDLSENHIRYIILGVINIISNNLRIKGVVKLKGFGSFITKAHSLNKEKKITKVSFKSSKYLLNKIN